MTNETPRDGKDDDKPMRASVDDLVAITEGWRRALERSDAPIDVAPPAGGWSPAEHALHVALTLEVVAAAFLRGKREGFPPLPEIPIERAAVREFVLTTFRIKRGGEAPEAIRPDVILPLDALSERLRAARAAFEPLLDLAGRSREEAWIPHFALGPLSFREALRFLYVHSLHHLRIVLKMTGRPT
jgi:hypothetical protein